MSRLFERGRARFGLAAVGAMTLAALTPTASAADGTWTLNNNGVWSGSGNWVGGVIADGAGFTGDFTQLDITGNRTITIDGAVASRTLGVLLLGDSTEGTGFNNYTIAANGGGTLTFNNNGSAALLNQVSNSGNNIISAPVILADDLNISNNSSNTLTISGGVTGPKTITNLGVGTGTATISGVIGANVTGVVQNSATSQLNLTGANLFTSGATILQGTLRAGNNTALGVGTAILGAASGSNDATFLVGTATLANAVMVQAGSTGNTLTIAGDGNATARLSGNISLDNNLGLRVNGGGESGRSITSSGPYLRTDGAISGSGNLDLVVNGNASTSNAGGQPQMDSLVVAGPVATSGTISNTGAGSGRAIISGNITSAAALNQNSATSMLTLSGSNSYSGDTTVNAGVLRLSSTTALSANTTVAVKSGATLQLSTNSATFGAGNTVNISGYGTDYSFGALDSTNNAVFAGTLVLQDDAAVSSDLATTTLTLSGGITGSGNDLTVSGVGNTAISGAINTGSGGLTKVGTGLLTLSGANNFTGVMNLNNGAVLLNNAGALGGGGDITFDGGSIRHSASNELDFGSRIVNSVGPVAVDTNGRNVTYSNIGASNVGGLAKLGTGRLTLDGTNAFSGPVVVSAGNLAVAATSALPSLGTGLIFVGPAGALNSGGAYANVQEWLDSGNIATTSTGAIALTANSSENIDFTGYSGLSLGASANLTYTGVITPENGIYRLGGGGATLTLSGNNALTGTNGLVVANNPVTLTGANDLTGATTVASSVLTLSGSVGALTNSSVTVNGGATLALVSGNSATPVTRAEDVILRRGTLTVSGNTAADITHAVNDSLTIGAGGSSTITLTGNGSRNVLLTANSLDRQAGGTALIRGTNLGTDFIGVNNVTNIQLANANLVGGTGSNGTDGGIMVGFAGDSAVNGTGYAATGGLLTYDDDNGVRLLTDSEYASTIVDGGSTLDNVRLASASGVIVTGTVNSNTTINSLSLRASGGTGSGVSLIGTGTLTLNSGVLYASHYGTSTGAFTVSNSIDFNGREGVILSNVTTTTGLNLNGILANTGSNGITFGGQSTSGNVTLGGAESNTYTGTMTINSSTVRLAKTGGATAVTGDVVVNNGGRLVYTTNDQIADSSNVTINGGFFQSDGTETIASLSANSGATVNLANFTVTNDLSISGGSTLTTTVNRAVSVGGDLNLSDGGSVRILRSQNIGGAYDSTVTVGGLNITNAVSGAYTAITIDHGVGLPQSGGKLILNGDVAFTGNSTNANTVLIDAIKGTGRQGVIGLNGTRDFDIGDGAANVDLRITGELMDDASAGGLTKNGLGTLDLTGASTYTGATTVNEGTLLINGSGVSAVTVNGGVFGGTGTINNSVSIGNDGVLAPGNGAGMLSTGDLFLTGDNATIAMEIGGIGAGLYDQVNVTGGVNLDGNGKIAITMISFIPQPTDIFFLILNDGVEAISGTLFDLAQGGTFTSGGYTWQVSYTGDSVGGTFTGGNDLALQIIPEPGAWILATGGLMVLTFLRRRRQA